MNVASGFFILSNSTGECAFHELVSYATIHNTKKESTEGHLKITEKKRSKVNSMRKAKNYIQHKILMKPTISKYSNYSH